MLTTCQLFKALSDETRLRCLVLLHRQGKKQQAKKSGLLEAAGEKDSKTLSSKKEAHLKSRA